jgi:hypothetical protein
MPLVETSKRSILVFQTPQTTPQTLGPLSQEEKEHLRVLECSNTWHIIIKKWNK